MAGQVRSINLPSSSWASGIYSGTSSVVFFFVVRLLPSFLVELLFRFFELSCCSSNSLSSSLSKSAYIAALTPRCDMSLKNKVGERFLSQWFGFWTQILDYKKEICRECLYSTTMEFLKLKICGKLRSMITSIAGGAADVAGRASAVTPGKSNRVTQGAIFERRLKLTCMDDNLTKRWTTRETTPRNMLRKKALAGPR